MAGIPVDACHSAFVNRRIAICAWFPIVPAGAHKSHQLDSGTIQARFSRPEASAESQALVLALAVVEHAVLECKAAKEGWESRCLEGLT